MKSFFSFFALFVALVSSVFVLGYNADNLLQKTTDLSFQEGSGVSISDHREAYPGVVYTRYIDGKKISDISTPGLLLDWNTFSQHMEDDGDNRKQRKIERVMKDDFQESKEYLANLSVINTAPLILDAMVVAANLETIQYRFSAFDPAISDYPLTTQISLATKDGVVVSRQEYALQDSQAFEGSFETNFARCNKELVLSFRVSDDIDSVEYTAPVYVNCPVSTTIKIEEDMISSHIYSTIMSSTMYSLGGDQTIKKDPSLVSLLKDSFNILFSKGFLQAIAIRKVIL